MEKITLTIDGNKLEASPDQTILEVVLQHQIANIPTLCHDPKLPPYGSCYLCVVEVEGVNRLIPSCASPVSPGMVIRTDSEKIRAARKTALELLLSNHYADCLGPCKLTCPAGVDVQGYIALMAAGKHKEAVRLIKETNPLPLVCGRVCVRECEVACRRNRVDDRVGIDYLKRYATDIDIEDPWTPIISEKNGKKVAVVGGGPAGLTCAYYLILKGYAVSLWEKAPKLGGMLRYGIPEYRLPKALLDKEIQWIIDLGVEVKMQKTLGKDLTIDSLKQQGFAAIFLAFGAQKAKAMRLADEEKTTGILPGIDFLWQLQSENKPEIHGKIVVVGGGNTAIDAARTALRLGAEKVTLLYRRTRNEMPAHQMEIEAALHEGVELIELAAPTRIVSENGRLKTLECIRMELGDPDESGRRSPVPMAGSEYQMPCDFAISAIGQDIDLCGLAKDSQLKVTRQNALVVSEETLQTSIPGIYAGGDMATGPSVAIAAIAHGKIAANAIYDFLKNGKELTRNKDFISRRDDFGEIPDAEFDPFSKIKKEIMPELPPEERIQSFVEVETGFTAKQAETETRRCLECGCSAFFDCDLRKHASDFGAVPSKYLGEVKKYKVDKHHPFITLDPNKCIACGRCVRTCSEILKVSALGFVYRGFRSIVKPSLEKKLLETNCISCGNCIAACPTGAISESLPFVKPGPWKLERKHSICHFCSVGCHLEYRVFDAELFHVGCAGNDTPNRSYLCSKGRFGYRYMQEADRQTKPLIRKNGALHPCSWDEALDAIAERFQNRIKEKGPESIGISLSPRLSNEEMYLLQRTARAAWKTNQITSFTRMLGNPEKDSLREMIGFSASSASLEDLVHADIILVFNAELTEENLIAELKIKEAQKRGARLIVFSSYASKLAKEASLWIDCKRGTSAIFMAGTAKALIDMNQIAKPFIRTRTSGFEAMRDSLHSLSLIRVAELTGVDVRKISTLAEWLSEEEANVVAVTNQDAVWEKSPQDMQAMTNLFLLIGRLGKSKNGILLLSNYANSQGLVEMGVDPHWLPGQIGPGHKAAAPMGKAWKTDLIKVFQPMDFKSNLASGKTDTLMIVGEDPLNAAENFKWLANEPFLVVADYFLTPTAQAADVFLPLSLFVESEGSYTACDRRVQKTERLFQAKTGKENWEWIIELNKRFGHKLPYPSVSAIASEMHKLIPGYPGSTGDSGQWDMESLRQSFPTANSKASFVPLSLAMTSANSHLPVLLSSENHFIHKIKGKLVV